MFAPHYFDHNATTPLDERVLACMLPFLRERYGNPSSRHEYGRAARDAIERARYQVASAVNAHATEVIFTSSGSEANNLFLKGAAACLPLGALAVGAAEHPCVRQPALQLRAQGWRVLELALDKQGVCEVEAAVALLEQERPALVSLMLANNETGAINDVMTLAKSVRAYGGYVHADAVQALGKIKVDFRALGVHALSLSSHKIYGPLGAGALVLDKRVELQPQIAGGGQERGLRSGTENVAAIVGFGLACELSTGALDAEFVRLQTMRDTLERGLRELGAVVFASSVSRLPNTSFFGFEGVDGDTLVGRLDRAGFAMASGAACSSMQPEPSRTLLAMGVEAGLAKCAVRVSLGRANSLPDIDRFLLALRQTVEELKRLTAVAV